MPEHAASFESLSYFRNPHVSSANEPATLCGGDFAAAISSDSGKYLPGHLGLDFKNCQFLKNLFCFKIFTWCFSEKDDSRLLEWSPVKMKKNATDTTGQRHRAYRKRMTAPVPLLKRIALIKSKEFPLGRSTLQWIWASLSVSWSTNIVWVPTMSQVLISIMQTKQKTKQRKSPLLWNFYKERQIGQGINAGK